MALHPCGGSRLQLLSNNPAVPDCFLAKCCANVPTCCERAKIMRTQRAEAVGTRSQRWMAVELIRILEYFSLRLAVLCAGKSDDQQYHWQTLCSQNSVIRLQARRAEELGLVVGLVRNSIWKRFHGRGMDNFFPAG